MDNLVSFQDIMELRFVGGSYIGSKCIAVEWDKVLTERLVSIRDDPCLKRLTTDYILLILPIAGRCMFHHRRSHNSIWGKIYKFHNVCKCGNKLKSIYSLNGVDYYCPKCLR